MNPVSHEPVVVQALAAAIAWLAARYGLRMSEADAFKIAGFVVVGLVPFVRQLVRPTAKDPQPPTLAPYLAPYAAAPAQDARTGLDSMEVAAPKPSTKTGPPVDDDG